jgi:hypothetical protein
MTTIHYRSVEVDGLRIFYREAREVEFPAGHMFRDLIPLFAQKCHLTGSVTLICRAATSTSLHSPRLPFNSSASSILCAGGYRRLMKPFSCNRFRPLEPVSPTWTFSKPRFSPVAGLSLLPEKPANGAISAKKKRAPARRIGTRSQCRVGEGTWIDIRTEAPQRTPKSSLG